MMHISPKLLQEHLLATIDQLRTSKNASVGIVGDYNDLDTFVLSKIQTYT